MPISEIQYLGSLVLFLIGLVAFVSVILLVLRLLARPPESSATELPKSVTRRAPVNRTNGLHAVEKTGGIVASERQIGLTETRPSESTENDLVPIAVFSSAHEANQAREQLRAAGIVATLVGEHAVSADRTYHAAIELHVRQHDAVAALEVLDELGTLPPLDDDFLEVRVPLDKAGDLVTVATFDSPIAAQLAQTRLEEAGIRATLADAQLIAMDWAMSNAIGGIKLQVLGSDAAAALRVLRTATEPAHDPSDAFSAEPFVEHDPPPNEREANAERAFKGALLGILLWPIQFYVLTLLLAVWGSPERLRAEYRTKALQAAFVCVPFVAVMLLPVALLVWFSQR